MTPSVPRTPSIRVEDKAPGASAHTIALESTSPQTEQMRAQVGPVHDRSAASPFDGGGAGGAGATPESRDGGAEASAPAPSTSGAVTRATTPKRAASFATAGAPRDQAAGATVIDHA